MRRGELKPEGREQDALRLLGLSRIPRCADCPRLFALSAAHRKGSFLRTLPPAPVECRSQICAPLVSRFSAPRR